MVEDGEIVTSSEGEPTASKIKIRTRQFPEFVGALTNFGANVRDISLGFSHKLGEIGLGIVLDFPRDPHVDNNTVLSILSMVPERYNLKTLSELYEEASKNFTTLTGFFPNLYYMRGFRNERWFALREKWLGKFSFNLFGYDPYRMFQHTLMEGMVEFPQQFETAYGALTTGTWRGTPIVEEESLYTPGYPRLHTPVNIIRAPEGSELDEAFGFFSALGFFQRRVSAKTQELGESNVTYLLGIRGVSLEKMPGRDEYLSYSNNSVFGRYCLDQQLLEALVNARTTASES